MYSYYLTSWRAVRAAGRQVAGSAVIMVIDGGHFDYQYDVRTDNSILN